MSRSALVRIGVLLGTAVLLGSPPDARAVSPGFTYQGQVLQAGVPVTGPCDVAVGLHTAGSGGTQLGVTQTVLAVAVSGGVFTVLLNAADEFGPGAFDGADRYLELAVRCPAGSGSYVVLAPRQAVTATPYALHAMTVAPGAVASSSIADGTIATVDLADQAVTSAKIADGTVTAADVAFPYAGSTSAGGPASDLACTDCVTPDEVSAAGSTAGQVLTSDGSSVAWQALTGLTLPYSGTAASSTALVRVENTGSGRGLEGRATGAEAGVLGLGAPGVSGLSGDGMGVYAQSTNGTGLYATTQNGADGVYGVSGAGNGTGVRGEATGASGIGVQGKSNQYLGVYGESASGTAVRGDSATGTALRGVAGAGAAVVGVSALGGVGMYGETGGSNGIGVQAVGSGVNGMGLLGEGAGVGVAGRSTSSADGVFGQADGSNGTGVHGVAHTGTSAYGIWGESNEGHGVVGDAYGSGNGVRGFSASGNGVEGESQGNLSRAGVLGSGGIGVAGMGTASGVKGVGTAPGSIGVLAVGSTSGPPILYPTTRTGLFAYSSDGAGVRTAGDYGLQAYGSNVGLYAENLDGTPTAAYLATRDHAADFIGPVRMQGAASFEGDLVAGGASFAGSIFVVNLYAVSTIAAPVKLFQIDHPLDPDHKHLRHASVESPEMTNFYSGNVTLDDEGEGWVELPEWFEALNADFRYQLTPIGGAAPRLHVAEEVHDNRFKIGGGRRGLKVSWRVAGIRHDTFALANPLEVETEKPADGKAP